jgi:hypothetical protein
MRRVFISPRATRDPSRTVQWRGPNLGYPARQSIEAAAVWTIVALRNQALQTEVAGGAKEVGTQSRLLKVAHKDAFRSPRQQRIAFADLNLRVVDMLKHLTEVAHVDRCTADRAIAEMIDFGFGNKTGQDFCGQAWSANDFVCPEIRLQNKL